MSKRIKIFKKKSKTKREKLKKYKKKCLKE